MKLNDAFPSNWLKAADCEDQNLVLTIVDCTLEDIKTQNNATEKKLVLRFRETDKGLICNKTNATSIAKLYGDDTDDWIGKRITLYASEVAFGGEMVMSIRVSIKAPKAPAANGKSIGSGTPSQARPAPTDGATMVDDDDDSVPF